MDLVNVPKKDRIGRRVLCRTFFAIHTFLGGYMDVHISQL